MDFKNGAELLSLCETRGLPISRIMKEREIHLAETTTEEMDRKMKRFL